MRFATPRTTGSTSVQFDPLLKVLDFVQRMELWLDDHRRKESCFNRLILLLGEQSLRAAEANYALSANRFKFLRPTSKCLPISRSIFVKSPMSFMKYRFEPCIDQVTLVSVPSGSRVNSFSLLAWKGFTKVVFILIVAGERDSVISIRPLPVLPLPLHSEIARTPLAAPRYVRFIEASSVSCGAHCGQRWKSLIKLNSFSRGAAIKSVR